MAHDLTRAVDLLQSGAYTCVLCGDGQTVTSDKRGVAPLLGWIEAGLRFPGYSAADKIVGKAAALLFVTLGVRAVYAPVMSESAAAVLKRYGVEAHAEQLVGAIINRAGTGRCPMEQAVQDISEPEEALCAIREKLRALSGA